MSDVQLTVALLARSYEGELFDGPADLAGLCVKPVDDVGEAIDGVAKGVWQLVVCVGEAAQLNADFEALKDSKVPTILGVSLDQASAIGHLIEQCDDFVVLPIPSAELCLRARKLVKLVPDQPHLVEKFGIAIDTRTYQASVDGRLLDMTYMEYELLKYFVTNPQQVLSREQLLRDVWKYEYFGGGRTVDVHVRRLRAKLGTEYSPLIQTVRSVGYYFGNLSA